MTDDLAATAFAAEVTMQVSECLSEALYAYAEPMLIKTLWQAQVQGMDARAAVQAVLLSLARPEIVAAIITRAVELADLDDDGPSTATP